jgi:hypothetical protein
MSSLPTTKPSNPLKAAVQAAYRRQHGCCWNCKCDISTGYYIEHLIDKIVILACETCKRDEPVERAS